MTRPRDMPTFLTQVPLCIHTDGPSSPRSVTEKVSSTYQLEELIALDLFLRQHCGSTGSLITSQWQNQFLKTKEKKKTKAPYNKSFGCASWYSSLDLSHDFITTSTSLPWPKPPSDQPGPALWTSEVLWSSNNPWESSEKLNCRTSFEMGNKRIGSKEILYFQSDFLF